MSPKLDHKGGARLHHPVPQGPPKMNPDHWNPLKVHKQSH